MEVLRNYIPNPLSFCWASSYVERKLQCLAFPWQWSIAFQHPGILINQSPKEHSGPAVLYRSRRENGNRCLCHQLSPAVLTGSFWFFLRHSIFNFALLSCPSGCYLVAWLWLTQLLETQRRRARSIIPGSLWPLAYCNKGTFALIFQMYKQDQNLFNGYEGKQIESRSTCTRIWVLVQWWNTCFTCRGSQVQPQASPGWPAKASCPLSGQHQTILGEMA